MGNQPPAPINMSKFTMYCMGEGWVNQRAVNQEKGFLAAEARQYTDWADRMTRSSLQQEDRQNVQRAFAQQAYAPVAPPPTNLLARMFNPVVQLFQQMVGLFNATDTARQAQQTARQARPNLLLQAAQLAGQMAGKLFDQVAALVSMTFFKPFNRTKDDDLRDRENAQRDYEISEKDIFQLQKVNESQGAGLGGGK